MSATLSFAPFFAGQAEAESLDPGAATAAYAQGYDDGRRDAEAAGAQRIAATLDAIAEHLQEASAELDKRMSGLERECAAVAVAFARRFSAGATPPAERIESCLKAIIADVADAPVLTIWVSSALADDIEPRLARIVAEYGAKVRPVIAAAEKMQPGDCSIQWRGGALVHEQARIEAQIAAEIARVFPGKRMEDNT